MHVAHAAVGKGEVDLRLAGLGVLHRFNRRDARQAEHRQQDAYRRNHGAGPRRPLFPGSRSQVDWRLWNPTHFCSACFGG